MAGQLRLSYLTQAKLGFGATRARNVGIRNAASEICIMLDCGVLAGTDFVSEHVRAHRSGPDRRVVVGYSVPLWRTGETDRRSVDIALSLLTPVIVAMHVFFLSYASGDERTGRVVLAAAVALVIALIGNGLPKTPMPDVAQSGALRLDERPTLDRVVVAARRGKRRAAPGVVVLGLVALVLAFVDPTVSLGVSVLAVVVMGLVAGVVVLRSAVRPRRT